MGFTEVDERGVGEFALFAEFAVEGDFLRDGFAVHVEAEFFDIAFAFGSGDEVFFELLLAGGDIGIIPIVLVGKEEVFELLPVALESGGIGGRSGGGAVRVVTLDEVAVNDGDFAVIFFDELVELRVDGGTAFALVVGVLEDEDGGVGVALDVFGEVARLFARGDDSAEVFGCVAAVGDANADGDSEDGDNDCDDDSSFLVHDCIIS